VNRLSPPRHASRRCRQAALTIFLLAFFPVAAFAQKPVAAPHATAAASFPDPAPPPDPNQKQMLAQDSRLDRPISLDIISVPLGEVLQKQSLDRSTETMEDGHRFLLTAAPDCADLKLQIRLNARPLRTLMTALAEMLPGMWTRTPHGYQLSMTKQAAAARAEWWHLFLGEREKALALQHQAVLDAMQTKAYRRKDSDPDPEQSDRVGEVETANQHDFFQSLPPALKEQIAANMDDSAFYEEDGIGYGNGGEQVGTIGRLSQMSPQTQERFKVALQDSINRLAQSPPAYQKYVVQAQRDMSALDPNKIYFLFQNGGITVLATSFNCPTSVSTLLHVSVPQTKGMSVLSLNQAELADEVYGSGEASPGWKRQADSVLKMGDAAPPEWKRLAAFQRSRVWPNTLPKLPPEDQSTWHPAISRAAQTDWLGERGHMEYVCDYYSRGGYEMPEAQKKLLVKRPLATEMDEMAAKRDVSWVKDADGIYLVRDNRWYREDNLEVPEPLLRRWFGALLQVNRQEAGQVAPQATTQATPQAVPQSPEEQTAVMKQNWDWAAEVFGTLTPWQIRNGLALFQPEEKDLAPQNDATAAKLYAGLKHRVPQPGETVPLGFDAFAQQARMPPFYQTINFLKGFPHTAQFYGSLDDAGRVALLTGRLPVSALSAPQVTQAVSLQPLLPQALQNFPPDSVFLGWLCRPPAPRHVVFGGIPQMRLEVTTPAAPSPQSAP